MNEVRQSHEAAGDAGRRSGRTPEVLVRYESRSEARVVSMRRRRKILLLLATILLALMGCFITFIGPWPTYTGGFEDKSYYAKALAAIEQHGRRSSDSLTVGLFPAGWASRLITPPAGTPLAGYGDRKGRPSTGVHDDIHVKALAVSDGMDVAVVVGADMLIIPENVADGVRARLSQQTPLTANDNLFAASHSHSGPGAFGPDFASRIFNGAYDPKVAALLTTAFAEAIVEAYQSLGRAKVAYGGADVPEYIRNRTRIDGRVDSELS